MVVRLGQDLWGACSWGPSDGGGGVATVIPPPTLLLYYDGGIQTHARTLTAGTPHVGSQDRAVE